MLKILHLIKFASKPEPPGLSSSLSLEAMFMRTQTPIKSDSINQPDFKRIELVVAVAQVSKLVKFASNPEQPGPSS